MNRLAKIIFGVIVAAAAFTACAESPQEPEPLESQVLFVCLHGNVKSLMATSYFNELATQRGLQYRAISRGTEPDSTTVPPAIIQGLSDDGFDVSAFSPTAVTKTDVLSAKRVVLINTELSASIRAPGTETELWSDVPPASVDYGKARDSLKSHVEQLIEQLSGAQ